MGAIQIRACPFTALLSTNGRGDGGKDLSGAYHDQIPELDQLLLWRYDRRELEFRPVSSLSGFREIVSSACYVAVHIFSYPSDAGTTVARVSSVMSQKGSPLELSGVRHPLVIRTLSQGNRTAEIRLCILPGSKANNIDKAMCFAEACELGEVLRRSEAELEGCLSNVLSCRSIGKFESLATAFPNSDSISLVRKHSLPYLTRGLLCENNMNKRKQPPENRRAPEAKSAWGSGINARSAVTTKSKNTVIIHNDNSSCRDRDNQGIEPMFRAPKKEDSFRRPAPARREAPSLNFSGIPRMNNMMAPKIARGGESSNAPATNPFSEPAPTHRGIRHDEAPAFHRIAGGGGGGGNQRQMPRGAGASGGTKKTLLDFRGVPNVTGLETKIRKMANFENDCTEVADRIYVAGERVARDLAALESNGITHVINCAGDVVPECFPERFRYLTFFLRDSVSEDISAILAPAIAFIDAALHGSDGDDDGDNDGGVERKLSGGLYNEVRRVREGERWLSSPSSLTRSSGGPRSNSNSSSTLKSKVLIHCHQGVSRSCAVAIAYLMFRSGNDYDTTYRAVKARRRVCRPNLKFTCDLLDFHTRRTGKSALLERPALFRVARHAPGKSPLLVCQRLERAHISALDRRGVFVLQPAAREYGESVVIWIGSHCSGDTRRLHVACAQSFVRYLFDVERVDGGRRITVVESGKGKYDPLVAFLTKYKRQDAVTTSIGTLKKYDVDYEGKERIGEGRASSASLVNVEDGKRAERAAMATKTLNLQIQSTENGVTEVELDDDGAEMKEGKEIEIDVDDIDDEEDDDSSNGDDNGVIDACLFEYPNYENLPSFCTDDLFPDKAYVLFSKRGIGEQWLHVWLGDEFEIPTKFGGDANEFAEHVAAEMRQIVPELTDGALVVVENEDDESEEFLEGFKEG